MKKTKPNMSRYRGFALLEALIALLIVSGGILGVAKLQTVVTATSIEAKYRATATHLAQSKLEEFRRISNKTAFMSAASGTDTVNVGNLAIFSRSWTVTGTTEPRDITVTVSWTSPRGTESTSLSTQMVWIDPALSSQFASSNPTGGILNAPPRNAVRGEFTPVSLPAGAELRSDGTAIVFDSSRGQYVVYVRVPTDEVGQYRIAFYSNDTVVVAASGLIVHDQFKDTRATPDWSKTGMVVSNVGYCVFPLAFDATSPWLKESYTIPTNGYPDSSISAGYRCYVPQGWYGIIDVMVPDEFKTSSNLKACPETGTAATALGARSHRVIIRDVSGNIIGQSGVTPSHYDGGKLDNLDFVIYSEKKSNPPIGDCQALLNNASTKHPINILSATDTSIQINRLGTGGINSLDPECRTTTFCLKPYDYWIEEVVGLVAVSGSFKSEIPDLHTVALTADTDCKSTGCGCTTNLDTETYSCAVRTGSTFTITPPSEYVLCGNTSFSNIRNNRTNVSLTLKPLGSTC